MNTGKNTFSLRLECVGHSARTIIDLITQCQSRTPKAIHLICYFVFCLFVSIYDDKERISGTKRHKKIIWTLVGKLGN